MDIFYVILLYLDAVNLLVFFTMLSDRRRAARHREPVPDVFVLLGAVLGGSIGGLAAMLLFGRKREELSFRLGLPVILGLQVGVFLLLFGILSH